MNCSVLFSISIVTHCFVVYNKLVILCLEVYLYAGGSKGWICPHMVMSERIAEILLATYNGQKYIGEQIDSILKQKDQRWHLTLSDDGSTDGTVEILDEYVRKYPQKIQRIESGRRFGNARDHFFWMIGQCRAEYVLTCDQDDVWYEEKLGKTLGVLLKAEEMHGKACPILVFSDQRPTNAQLIPLASSLMRYQNQFFEYFDYRSILMQNVVTGGAMGFNRALAELAMKCTQPAQTIMHDWWMAAVAARFGKVVYIDEPLGDYRQHGTNSVGAKNVKSISHVMKKLGSLQDIRATIVKKKQQAECFEKTYASSLEKSDLRFLKRYTRSRSGLVFYWQYRRLIHGFFRLAGAMVLG